MSIFGKEERSEINDLSFIFFFFSFSFKKPGKAEQIKPMVSRKKEIMEIENRKSVEKNQ